MSEATPNRSSWQARIGEERVELDDMNGLHELVLAGRLRPEHYVYHPPTQRWIYAREVPELRDAFAAKEIAANPSAWIAQIEGRNCPFRDLDAMKGAIHEGRIRRGTLIRHPVLERWMRASDILEIAEELQQQPDIPRQVSRKRESMTPQTIGVIALVFIVLLLAGIGIYRGVTAPDETGASVRPATTTGGAAPASAPEEKPKVVTWLFGEEEKKEEVATATSTDSTATATTTETAAEAEAKAPEAEPAAETPSAPQPKREDAESLYEEETGELRVQPTVSGDTPVMIDRSHVDPHYHATRCPNVTSGMTSVSLDLARQNYTPCPICKPPR